MVEASTLEKWKSCFKGFEVVCRRVEKDEVLVCSLCCRALSLGYRKGEGLQMSPWAVPSVGCQTFKRDALKDHWKSTFHIEATGHLCRYDEKQTKGINDYIENMLEEDALAVVNGLKVVAFQAAEMVPIHKFTSFINNLGKKLWKVPNLQESYTNWRFAWQAVEALSSHLTQKLRRDLAQSPCYTVQFDELTDCTTKALLIVYVGYIKQGRPATSFGLCREMESTTGEAIAAAVKSVCHHLGIKFSSLTSFATDGASAMSGSRCGAQAFLKKLNPYALHSHCVAHISALASADMFLQGELKDLDVLLSLIFAVFTRSAKMSALLQDIQEELELKPLKMLQFHSIRWLSRHKVLNRVLERLVPLLICLESDERKDSKAMEIVMRLLDFRTMGLLRYSLAVVEKLASFNRFLQNRNLHPADIKDRLDVTICELKADFIADGVRSPSIVRWLEEELELEADGDDVMWPKTGSVEQADTANRMWPVCRKSELEGEKFMLLLTMMDTTKKIVESLKRRFSNLLPLFEACKFMDPRQWPTSDKDLVKWGREGESKDWKEILNKQYGEPKTSQTGSGEYEFTPPINFQKLEEELPRFLLTVCSSHRRACVQDTYSCILMNAGCWERFPNCTKLVAIISTLIASTVECERGVSMVNALKKDETNRLMIGHLNDLARIRATFLEDGARAFDNLNWRDVYDEWHKKHPNGRKYAPDHRQLSEEFWVDHDIGENEDPVSELSQRKVQVLYKKVGMADETEEVTTQALSLEAALIADEVVSRLQNELQASIATRNAVVPAQEPQHHPIHQAMLYAQQMARMQGPQYLQQYWAAAQLQFQAYLNGKQ
jgi:hypothetical protein